MAEFYLNSARIIEQILQKKGTPKTLVIENTRIKNKKKLYALVCEAIKYKSVTDQLLEDTKLLSMEKQLKYPMALVLVYDFLFGRGLQVGGQLKQAINRNKTSLQAALARMKVREKVVNNEDLLPLYVQDQNEFQIPRYVRVNTLKTTTDEVITWFSKNGFKLRRRKNETLDSSQMANEIFSIDKHIPDVLVFPPGTDLHDNSLYEEGKIILQDKASCFPAFVLSPPSGTDVIDACAAPGNKTSHLAAAMDNNGLVRKIFAFDISEKRILTMKKLLKRAGETIVEAKHEDFLQTDPSDPVYTNVQYILVDPSCSGSGIINRLDYVTSDNNNMDEKERERVRSLAQFQVKILSHALSFPAVKRVVYSTCSLHNMENEEVVMKCLENFHEKFELKMALPHWPHRGHPVFPEASKCVRASPKEGSTSGFFLALFETKDVLKIMKLQQDKIQNDLQDIHSTSRTATKEEKNQMEIKINLKKRKRESANDVRKVQRITENGRMKLMRTHRRCSNKEFEKNLKLLQEIKHRRTILAKK